MSLDSSHRHPAFSAFWAHPWNNCHEVQPSRNYQDFVTSLRDFKGRSLDDALAQRWIAAVRRTGDRDFWWIHCQEFKRSQELIFLLCRYLKKRYPGEGAVRLEITPERGEGFAGSLDEFIAQHEPQESNDGQRRPRLPGNPDMPTSELWRDFDRYCRQPYDRCHHPVLPGHWLHPSTGSISLGPADHHSDYFLAHPEVFEVDLGKAYKDGWVAVRRWTNFQEEWILRYHNLERSIEVLRKWASEVIEQHPDERLIPVHCFPSSSTSCLSGTLGELADGSVRWVSEHENLLPPPEQWLKGNSTREKHPWIDYVAPKAPRFDWDEGFKPISPSCAETQEGMLHAFHDELDKIEALQLYGRQYLCIAMRRASLRSWVYQLETGDLPACVGEGYREWVTFLRQRSGLTTSEDAQ